MYYYIKYVPGNIQLLHCGYYRLATLSPTAQSA